MATDTKVTELVLNELTEEKLKELEDAGAVPPNEVFFTDDDETSPRGLPLGTIVPVAVISDDASLHLLDGSSLIQNGIYKQFCDWLKARVLANSASVPTCTIAEYASEMSTYGQCGKFVINDTSEVQTSNGYRVEANSIKLPTITEFIASNNGGDTIGLAELDMFKIHYHNVGATNHYTYMTSGDNFHIASTGYPVRNRTNNELAYTGGEETRPKNVRYPYYIVVATSVKTNVEVDIDNVASDINEINGVLNNTERVETIYDMNDSTKDWGYSDGIIGGITLNKDLSKYKKIKITPRFFHNNATNTGGISQVFEMNVKPILRPNQNLCVGTWGARYIKTSDYFVGSSDFGMSCYYNTSTKELSFHFSYLQENKDVNSEYTVIKIEGVY